MKMQPPSYSIFDHTQTKEDELARDWVEANSSSIETRQPNWIGVVLVGVAFFAMGILLAGVSGGGSLIFVFLGVLIILAAMAAKNIDFEEPSPDIEPESYDYTESFAPQYDEYRRQLRQDEIDQIVKAVKTTIRVRCTYCGTLNEEKADKCESCGAPL